MFCSIPANNSRKYSKNFFLILLTSLSLYTQNAFITAIALLGETKHTASVKVTQDTTLLKVKKNNLHNS